MQNCILLKKKVYRKFILTIITCSVIFCLFLSAIYVLFFIEKSWSKNTNKNKSVSFEYVLNNDNESYAISKAVVLNSSVIEIPLVYNDFPITRIEDKAFLASYYLTSVVISDNIQYIGKNAFQNCPMLSEVQLGNSVKEIGDYAFADNRCLSMINIPDSVIKIGEYAFSGCSSLTKVYIGNKVEELREYSFSNCTTLNYIKFSTSIMEIENNCFLNCNNLKKIEYEGSQNEYDRIVIGENNDTFLKKELISYENE